MHTEAVFHNHLPTIINIVNFLYGKKAANTVNNIVRDYNKISVRSGIATFGACNIRGLFEKFPAF